MKLSLEMIKSIAVGAARVERVGECIGLFRFTKEQERLYQEKSFPGFYKRTFATAGVTLEFETDSENLSLSVEVSPACGYRWFVHSIFVNDHRIGQVGDFVPENEVATAEGKFDLGKGIKRVRIVFPWNEFSRIKCLELDDGARVIPVRKKRKVLIFGDSITQGDTTWLPENSYASRISRWLDADMINKGIGGEKFWPELAGVPDDGQPDLVLIAYGANDWNEMTEEEFAANSRAFCLSLRKAYRETKIVVLTPIWMSTREAKQHERWPFEHLVLRLKALEHFVENLTVIDGTDLVPKDLACFAEDRVHPNDIGFRYYAHALRDKILN